MMKVMKSLVFALVLAVSVPSMAGQLSDYPSIRSVLNNDMVAIYTLWGCLEDGYERTDATYDPIYYLVAPQGEHTAGSVTVTLNKRSGGQNSLQTDYVFIKMNIIDDGKGTQRVGTMTVERMRVN